MRTKSTNPSYVRPAILVTAALGALLVGLLSVGCGDVECGQGTVEVDGVCQVGTVLECGVGFKALGNKCVPIKQWVQYYCGENAEYDEDTNTCIGVGGTVKPTDCTQKCPAVSGNTICVSGRVFTASTLMAKWGGSDTDPTPVSSTADNAVVKVYDPIDFVTNPSTSKPLKEVLIDKDGCFVAEGITIPFTGFVAVGVDDKDSSKDDWALAALGETPTPGQNSTGLEVPAVSNKEATAWGNNILADGSMFLIFQDSLGMGVDGVKPLYSGSPPGSDGKFAGTDMTVYYVAADPTDPTKAIDTSGTETSSAGVAVIKKAVVESFTGEKSGCTIADKLGGSSPGVLFFSIREVTGC